MNLHVKKIRLAQIRLETDFRIKEKDLSLEMSVQRHGLQVPLVVEMEGTERYVLVDGYRRYYALDFLGVQWADCVIELETSREERAVRRLRQELHGGRERRTAYQLDKMVHWLAGTGSFDPLLLAKLCSVGKADILKYIPGMHPLFLHDNVLHDNGSKAETDSLYSASEFMNCTPIGVSPYSPVTPVTSFTSVAPYDPSTYYPMQVPMSYALFDPLNSTNDLALRRLAEMDKILGEVYFY